MNTRTKGFLATVVSATFFGFIPLMVKVVCSGGGNTLAAAFYRFALSLPALYIYLKVKKIPMRITKTQLRDIVLITVLGYGGTTLILFSSYNYIPLGMATTIHFTYPVFTILGCVIFLHEKIKKMKVLAVALSFGGILFFYNADGSVSLPGMVLAFASGMTYAFYTIYLRESSLKDMDSVKLIFCLNTVGAAMMGAVALIAGDFTVGLTPAAWAVAVFLAVSASFIGVLGYQVGVKCIGPQNTAILSTFEPITSVILGILVYQESSSLRTLLGCLCILSSVIIVAKMKE